MILKSISNSGLEVIKCQEVRLNRQQAEQLYAIHMGKFFYERLIRHVTSGPIIAMILSSKNGDAIKCWRNLLGPSKIFKGLLHSEDPNYTLREKFALSDARNVAHGSDSEIEFQREVRVFESLFEVENTG
uniref:Nucleoside diphosphate kinase n=1 Tax=Acrobeloides nanus TaxID=290746 RepID=A0A914ECV0_9BILA